jgi:hypothetical protein
MRTSESLTRLAYLAVLAAAAGACSTQRSADDIAMRRAYETKVAVTGSRIRRAVDPATGIPNVGFRTTTIEGDDVRAMLRTLPAPAD